MQHKPRGKPLQLSELYSAYEAIAQDTGAGSRERKDKLVLALLSRASPLEAKYIVKHLVKEMRVGVSEATVLDGLADVTGIPIASIRRANQISGDMGEVARMALASGAAGLARLSVRLGVPLKPMLAQSAETMAEAFSKMDGAFRARIQAGWRARANPQTGRHDPPLHAQPLGRDEFAARSGRSKCAWDWARRMPSSMARSSP